MNSRTGTWPVFVERVFIEDAALYLNVGDHIQWNVGVIDGGRRGVPADVVCESTWTFEDAPPGRRAERVARHGDLALAWYDTPSALSQVAIGATLEAEWFNPPFISVIDGIIHRLQIGISETVLRERNRLWSPMRLVDVDSTDPLLVTGPDGGVEAVGLFAHVAINKSWMAPFTPDAREFPPRKIATTDLD